MEIFKLFGSIFVDNDEANKSIQKTGAEAEKSGGLLSKLGGFAQGAGAAVAAISGGAIAAATALGGIAMQSSEAASRINDMAQQLGISNEGFQEWDYILGLNGASIDSFGVGMKTLQQKMVDFGEGGKASTEMFDKLGMSMEQVSAMSPEQAMEAVITKLQEMPEGAEKADLALQAFGKQGMSLMPVLNMTAEETEELKNTAHDLGMVLSDDAVKAGDDFGDALDTAKGMVSGLANQLGAELLPSMTAGLEAFIGFVTGAEGAEDKMQEAFDGIVSAITEKMPVFLEKGASVVLSIVRGLAQALPSLVSGVIQIIPTIATTIMEMIPDILQAGIAVIVAVTNGISEALPEMAPVIVEVISTIAQLLVSNLPSLLDAGLTLILALADGIMAAIPALINQLPALISSVVDFITGAIPQIIQAGMALFTSLVGALPLIINSIVAVIPQILDGIITALTESLPLIIETGVELFVALVKALPQIITTIVAALPKIINSIVDALIGNVDKIIMAGVQLLVALVENAPQITLEILKAIPLIITSIVNAIIEYLPKMAETGLNLIKGLWQGINDAGAWLKDKISGFFGGVVDSIKDFFGIKSPSTLFAWIGEMNAEGFVNGIESMAGAVKGAVDDVFGYQPDVDYQALTLEAVEAGDMIRAAQLEMQRNLKIDGERDEVWSKTHLYHDYLPAPSDNAMLPMVSNPPTLSTTDTTATDPVSLAELMSQAMEQGFVMVSDTILEAIPKLLQFYFDTTMVAEAEWGALEDAATRRNRIFAPSRETIAAIALSVMPVMG